MPVYLIHYNFLIAKYIKLLYIKNLLSLLERDIKKFEEDRNNEQKANNSKIIQ